MIKKLLGLFSPPKNKVITVVSGLPRSGTSLMMKMLEAGGVPPLTDNQRIADTDNPKGYYEFERVKKLPKGDIGWLDDAKGKAVKIISALLTHLPESYTFQVIFMERSIHEVLISQQKMLVRRGEELTSLFESHVDQTNDWLQHHAHHITCLKVSYNQLLKDAPPVISSLNTFLGGNLDVVPMAQVIDPTLYRSKD